MRTQTREVVRKGEKWKIEGVSGSVSVDGDELLDSMFSYDNVCVYVVFVLRLITASAVTHTHKYVCTCTHP